MSMLLSFEEYKKLGGTADKNNYPKLEQNAEDLINPITHDFYVCNSIDTDEDTYRVKCFKKALELQIEFTNSLGASTPYDMAQQSITSVSIDGTTVSTDMSIKDLTQGGIYNLALEYLYRTGLLYRGIPSC